MTPLKVPAEIFGPALKAALQEALATQNLEDVTLFTSKEAAALLKVTPQRFREMRKDIISFGPQSQRITLRDLRDLIEKRRVKSNRS